MGTAVRPAKTSPASWDTFADVDVFVDEVLAELKAMVKDGARPMRSGPKPPLAGAALRKAVMAIWCVCFCGMQWRAIGLAVRDPLRHAYGLFARWTRLGLWRTLLDRLRRVWRALPHLNCSHVPGVASFELLPSGAAGAASAAADMGHISMATRDEWVLALAGRYASNSRKHRGRILDAFVAMSGFHRKHAMRLLRAGQSGRGAGPRPGRRIDGEAVRDALIVIWEPADVCGKQLRPLVPILVEAMERHGHPQLALEVRDGLVSMSAATIDRALCKVKEQATGGTGRRSASSAGVRRGWRIGINVWLKELTRCSHSGGSNLLGISLEPMSRLLGVDMVITASLAERWPVLAVGPTALAWLGITARYYGGDFWSGEGRSVPGRHPA
jgi:hypothetical protein